MTKLFTYESDKEAVAEALANMAKEIFTACRAESDYCVQSVSDDYIVFGGVNRLMLTHYGWSISNSHCTPRFKTLFKELFKIGT